MKIAFIGTGLMGSAMIKNLIADRYLLNIYNRTKAKTDELKNLGAIVTDTPKLAIDNSEIVITMLSDYSAISSVLFTNEIVFKDKTVIQMSTIAPDESLLLKERIEKLHGNYLEAPVLGSVPQIQNRTLITLIGATEKQYEKFKTLFESFGKDVILIGEVGKASALKLAFNQLIAAECAMFSLSLGYVRKKEIEVDKFMSILKKSAFFAPSFAAKLNNYLNDNYSNPHFPLKHMLKDINLVYSELQKQNINTLPLEGVKKILELSIKNNLDDLDYSAMYKIINDK
ncbi:NAD(P)-dependent oxidoreductase [Melioribacteraceae bacterium 4301-Me]|uniref:NAD(P)-dependent oxidoreductase n=1 Tax=Pyranulibacter aquaticus TaxID=3163344 RepID=UPI003596CD74